MKISVIIPIYNSEQYLENCLESIVNQSYENLEIILVNDGSTDKSLSICEKYAENDKRIVVLNKENGGQASARNLGLNYAKGDYIAFLDSDDRLSLETFSESIIILNKDKSIECVQFPVFMNYGTQKSYLKNYKSKLYIKDINIYNLWLRDNIITWIVCDKIIKSCIIKELRFEEDMIYEDNHFVIELIKRIKNIYISDKGLYYYYLRENSTTTSEHSKKKDLDTLKVLCRLLDELILIKQTELYVEYLKRVINIERSLLINFKFKSKASKKYINFVSTSTILLTNINVKDRIKLIYSKLKKN